MALSRRFLKHTKIRDDIMYNLEFKLLSISEQLNLSINLKALYICSSREAPAKAPIPNKAAAHFKMYPAALQPQIKHAPWTPEEDTTLLKMYPSRGLLSKSVDEIPEASIAASSRS
jgi:hypothetical protein